MTLVPIDRIVADHRAQPRVITNADTIAEYVEAMANGAVFPPIVVFQDGDQFFIGDGFHRYHAFVGLGLAEVECDVRPGGIRDAILFSCSANAAHGVRRTNEDKRHAVLRLLGDAEWNSKGIRWIARHCAVSEGFVHKLYHAAVSVHGEQIRKPDARLVERKGTVYPQNTARIGSSQPERAAAPVATPIPDYAEPILAVGVEITGDPEYPGERVWRCLKCDHVWAFGKGQCGNCYECDEPTPDPRRVPAERPGQARIREAEQFPWNAPIHDVDRIVRAFPDPEQVARTYPVLFRHSINPERYREIADWFQRFADEFDKLYGGQNVSA